MNAELDGANTEAQSRELEALLAADPSAREHFERLRGLTSRLASIESVDPPAHLLHRILSAIPFGKYPLRAKREREAGLFSWLGTLIPRPRLRYASAFAVGLVAGFVLLWATVANDRVDGSLDISNLYGTMKAINPSDGFREVGSVGIDLDQVRGEIRLHESDRRLLADVSLSAPEQIEWVLRYNASDVAFEGYRRLEGDSGAVAAAEDRMMISQVGESRYILFFSERENGRPDMSVEIFSDGKLLYQKDLAGTAGH
jgi:hypothetical protein